MIRRPFASALVASIFLLALFSTKVSAQTTYIWTGVSGTGWQGNVIVPSDGTPDLILPKAINNTIPIGADTFINSITVTNSDDYLFQGSSSWLLTINNNAGNGIYGAVGGNFNRLAFDSNISIAGTGNLKMDAGDGQIIVSGTITGSAALTLSNANGGTNGAFIFNCTGSGNDYTGDTFITGVSGTPVVVAFWNSSPFGTGVLNINNGAALIAHGSQRVDNDININTTAPNDPIYLKSWDDTLCFDGAVTLFKNTTLVAERTPMGAPTADNSGVIPIPGAFSRHVIDFEDDIDESGGSYRLTVNGPGVLLFEGSNSYSGGTAINGSLVFESAASIPGGANKVAVNLSGYAGVATAGDFAGLSARITIGSSGALGLDTMPGSPTATFADNIDLSSFTNSNIRIGTATSAILTGTITPQGANYQFGNGGGTLFVQSDLTGSGAVNMNNDSAVPLTLYLQGGSNTYAGGTNVNNGFVIFDSDGAFPSSGALTASGAGNSYIGITDQAYVSTPTFLGQFNLVGTNGIIGFDTNATTMGTTGPVAITDDIDLSTFNNGVYIGTATGVKLTGVLTPTADNILRLTAAQSSILQVDQINDIVGPLTLSLGTNSPSDLYSNGTILLPNANYYTGGTIINSTAGGITLAVGNSDSLGGINGGPLTLPQNVIAGLQASNFGVNLPNNIVFSTPVGMNLPAALFITGFNDLELSGTISGPGSITVINPIADPVLTLSGNNSAFSGDINLFNSTLILANDNAAGTGTIRFLDPGSVLQFATPAPIVYGISGKDGYIDFNDGDALTIDMSNSVNDHEFGGLIGGGSPPNATLTVTSTTGGDALYLYGASNNYAGGTFVGTSSSDRAALALGNANSAGTGPITLNTSLQGALAVNVGVTLTNNLNFIGGTLQGFGTFAPAQVNGVPGGPIIFDAGKGVIPGIFGLGSHKVTGTLTLATTTEFANGGKMLWSIQDGNTITRPDGQSLLSISSHDLNITATGGGFTLFLATLDANGNLGSANLIDGNPYVFPIATTSGGVVNGFSAADFTIDTSNFVGGVSGTPFLTADANNIFINFTPVPEPSTYALLGLGLGAVLFPALRRRKRV